MRTVTNTLFKQITGKTSKVVGRWTQARGEREVRRMQAQFDTLANWYIRYERNFLRKSQCTYDLDSHMAAIYEWDFADGPVPPDYIYHEMLHIALHAALDRSHKRRAWKQEERVWKSADEETLVRDLSAIYANRLRTPSRKKVFSGVV